MTLDTRTAATTVISIRSPHTESTVKCAVKLFTEGFTNTSQTGQNLFNKPVHVNVNNFFPSQPVVKDRGHHMNCIPSSLRTHWEGNIQRAPHSINNKVQINAVMIFMKRQNVTPKPTDTPISSAFVDEHSSKSRGSNILPGGQ